MSKQRLGKYRKELRQLSEKRNKLLQIFFSDEKLILGSHMETRMRCGTPGCHCHKDGGHPTVRISRREDGKLKSKIVRIDDREWVAKAAGNYKTHKKTMQEIEKLNKQEKDVLKLIIEQKAEIYE